MAADGAEQRGLEPRAASRADHDELRTLGLGDERLGRVALDEPRLDLDRWLPRKGLAQRGLELGVRGSLLGLELSGKIARRHRDHPRLADGRRWNVRPGVNGYETGSPELRLFGRPAQSCLRGRRPVDSDDDRPGHGISVRNRAR